MKKSFFLVEVLFSIVLLSFVLLNFSTLLSSKNGINLFQLISDKYNALLQKSDRLQKDNFGINFTHQQHSHIEYNLQNDFTKYNS